jgi:hypothetical protein
MPSFTELMEKIYIRLKYIHMALILNFNPNIPHGTGLSICIQRTYFKYLNNTRIVEFSILTEEIYDQKPQFLNSKYEYRHIWGKNRKLSISCKVSLLVTTNILNLSDDFTQQSLYMSKRTTFNLVIKSFKSTTT